MPELPEVETTKRQLSKLLADQPKLVAAEFFRKDLREPIPIKQIKNLIGQNILQIRRRAKYLIFEFPKVNLLSHLGMTGSWQAHDTSVAYVTAKHDHVVLKFSSGVRLVYADPRRFGYLGLAEEKKLSNLGIEPLGADFDGNYLWAGTRESSSSIKAWIMDQSRVVGVGNIYASEALFRCGIRPSKRASSLSLAKCQTLVEQIKLILEEAIAFGGSSVSDFRHTDGHGGNFQSRHLVYDREGEVCRQCSAKIRRVVIAGRSTFYCPRCQS